MPVLSETLVLHSAAAVGRQDGAALLAHALIRTGLAGPPLPHLTVLAA